MLVFKLPFHVTCHPSPGERKRLPEVLCGSNCSVCGLCLPPWARMAGMRRQLSRGAEGGAGGGERLKGRKRESPSYAFPRAPAAGGSDPARGWQRRGRHREGGGYPLRPSLPACLPARAERRRAAAARGCWGAGRAGGAGGAGRGAVLQHRGPRSAAPALPPGELSFSTGGPGALLPRRGPGSCPSAPRAAAAAVELSSASPPP